MDITPLIKSDAQVIQSYRGGVFKVSNQNFTTPVLVTALETRSWMGCDLASVMLQDFSFLTGYADLEVVLLGTGASFKPIKNDLRQSVKQVYGCSIDAMDTGAACRTYNVLLAEGRRVLAALLPV